MKDGFRSNPPPRRLGRVAIEDNGTTILGISVLSGLSIAGLHSAVNPSVFTLKEFRGTADSVKNAETGLLIGLGLSLAASGAIWAVFRNWIPTATAALTGAALFGIGWWAAHTPGKGDGFKQQTALPEQSPGSMRLPRPVFSWNPLWQSA